MLTTSPASSQDVHPTNSKIVLPTLIPSVTITQTVALSPSITPTPSATSFVCDEDGKIVEENFPSTVLKESFRFQIYLPPCYDSSLLKEYPLLLMLHGQNGQDHQWIDLGLTNLADQLIRAGEIPPMVIVFPWERLYLQDWKESKFDQAILQDLLPYLLEKYPLSPLARYHAIGGLSRGANWAVLIGMSHPELFGVIGGHSYPTFGGEIRKLPDWVAKFNPQYPPHLYFDIGKMDRYKPYCDLFIEALAKTGVSFEYHQNEGTHNLEYWQIHVADYLHWYGDSLRMVDGQ